MKTQESIEMQAARAEIAALKAVNDKKRVNTKDRDKKRLAWLLIILTLALGATQSFNDFYYQIIGIWVIVGVFNMYKEAIKSIIK